ncbi:uncharacterized protein LOC125941022 [Dermacentor silvarum]|uniref:uncharacterized protein LOC125941022 n=1 Tax=Dermacentor silvarum TaxID=543639 RepID=UPI002101325C|nr:uncharacterized protein LOC125941022 [Dermacentor silvarum]
MQLRYAYGIFLSWVLSCMVNRGVSSRLYLKKVVKEYIDKMNLTHHGSVSTWGFTEEYAYWRQQPPPKEHPVTAEVDWMSYDRCNPPGLQESRRTNCTGFFMWSAYEGVDCPFSLKHYTTLPVCYRGLDDKLFTLELNGLITKNLNNVVRQIEDLKNVNTALDLWPIAGYTISKKAQLWNPERL